MSSMGPGISAHMDKNNSKTVKLISRKRKGSLSPTCGTSCSNERKVSQKAGKMISKEIKITNRNKQASNGPGTSYDKNINYSKTARFTARRRSISFESGTSSSDKQRRTPKEQTTISKNSRFRKKTEHLRKDGGRVTRVEFPGRRTDGIPKLEAIVRNPTNPSQ
jgi:hypothetical protein